jgi:hypothetical protein
MDPAASGEGACDGDKDGDRVAVTELFGKS